MTTRRYVSVWCDGDDCNAWIGHEHTAKESRAEAKRFGWTQRDGRDLCPECSEAKP